MCEICLWGNATDLSLFANLSLADITALQGAAARKQAEQNIVVNDLRAAFAVLRDRKADRRVDIVLDNAGFELLVDLVLAGYLLHAGLATTVVLRPKTIPWFVSDVVPADFAALLSALARPAAFFDGRPALAEHESAALTFLFDDWSRLHADGRLLLRPDRFWTGAGSFWRLAAPDNEPLLADLRAADLVVFKGDLNYRKLTADVMWEPTTPFAAAIGPLGTGSGVRTLALRTCKADVVVGLPEGRDEALRAGEGGGGQSGARKWAWSGKWAVAQFCDGKAVVDGE